MKKIILATIVSLISNFVLAYERDCSVAPEFVKQQRGTQYSELSDQFSTTLFESWGIPINTEIIAAYEGDSESTMNSDAPCMAVKNTYVRDSATGKQYLMITSHEDYCDGGNTWGYIFDLEASQNAKQSIVGEINDGALNCVEKEKYQRLQKFLKELRWMM